jgi:uncharacterized membrane protein
MKQVLLFLAVMMLFITNSYSQATFNTGAIGVDVNQYGKIELFNSAGIYQLWRTSILVGASPTAVYDYQNDAEEFEPTILVTNPSVSDYEIYGAYDNSYSGDPPNVIVKLNAYGWTNGGYIIVKFNIKNNEATAMNALAGLDIIPFIDEEDGYDTVSYNSSTEVIRFHRGNQTNIGMKLLSSTLSSLYSFEYYDDYYVDSDYWTWMNYGSVQPEYASNTVNGSVSITSQDPVELAPGVSFDVYYAMALGSNLQTMASNISAAVQKYQSLFASVEDIELSAKGINLGQNYPNPFNLSTTISYQLPCDGFVSLKIYNAIGNEAATLVNSQQTGGTYTIHYNAKDLTSGVYYYTLKFNEQVKSHKMFLVK